MALILPVDDPLEQQAVYDFAAILGDREYRIVEIYRDRQDGWYLTLYDSADVPILSGKRLATNQGVDSSYVYKELPDGTLFFFSNDASGAECGFEDFGRRCFLSFLTVDDLPDEEDPDAPSVEVIAS